MNCTHYTVLHHRAESDGRENTTTYSRKYLRTRRFGSVYAHTHMSVTCIMNVQLLISNTQHALSLIILALLDALCAVASFAHTANAMANDGLITQDEHQTGQSVRLIIFVTIHFKYFLAKSKIAIIH